MRSPSGLVVDLFAGGGGASAGLEAALGRKVDIAINHDETAIAVHTANHPGTKHYTEDIWKVKPLEATGGKPVDILWASPDCTHFSIARGGKPNRSKKIRSLAWAVVRWAKAVRPKVILLENVREFQTWGPLDGEGRIVPHLKGRTFKAWLGNLRGLGYMVDWRILNAAEYGAPTSRRRLFLIARCDGKPIAWPVKTHGPGLLPFRTAGECIDWSIPCPSIFERKKPLADKTLWRIANGIRRFVLESPAPFIVKMRAASTGASLAEPMPTVTAGGKPARPSTGNPLALAAPVLAPMNADNPPMHVDRPAATVTSQVNRLGLVAPSLVPIQNFGWGDESRRADEPSRTITAGPKGGGQALCTAFIAKHFGGHETPGSQLLLPLDTVTSRDHNSLVAANLLKLRGQCHGASADDPMPTITGQGLHVAEVRSLLVAYYGCDKDGQGLLDPMRTLTVRDRLGLVTVEGVEYQIVDIGLRMLEPHELLRAQFGEFAKDYDLSAARTKTAKVRLIGNSVCPEIVRAIVQANTGRQVKKERAA